MEQPATSTTNIVYGPYMAHQSATDPDPYTARFLMDFDGTNQLVWTETDNSHGSGGTGTNQYFVSADGALTGLDNYTGTISQNASFFVMTDTDASDGGLGIMLGVKQWEDGTIAPPSNLSASDGIYTNKVRVAWSDAAGATGYQIFRHTANNSGVASQIGTTAAQYFDDFGVDPATTYYYWVKAVSAAGASALSAPDTGYLGVVGPQITMNGQVGDNVRIRAGTPVTILLEMMNLPAVYLGENVDWWVAAHVHGGGLWFYFNSDMILTPFDGNPSNCRPAYQGPLMNLPPITLVAGMLLAPGTYNIWFAVDYPMDGILDLGGTLIISQLTVVVE